VFNSVSSESARYRSGAVARMVGIPVSTLRIWERRYQVVGPALTDSGHRLYSGADVERLLLIKQLIDLGHAVGSVARLPAAALQDIADARAALQAPAAPAPARPRVALLGLGLPRRLGARVLERVGNWPDLAAAEAAQRSADAAGSAPLQADLLVAEMATLQPDTVRRLLDLMQRLGVRRSVVVYGFGAEAAAQRLRDAGCQLHRAPLADAELRALVDQALAGLAGPAAGMRGIACECPRHVAELVTLLGNFETYSAECVAIHPGDAALHAHLQHVAGSARAMFEAALLRLVDAEAEAEAQPSATAAAIS
jgi:DNA-binding transcriptional MerR regulator